MSSSSSRPLDIIIVGGGLAGLAAAGYLREQHNVTVSRLFYVSAHQETILNLFLLYRFSRDIHCNLRKT
jgi:glycine/D-amino acid oxidase-like deaminating enzyme